VIPEPVLTVFDRRGTPYLDIIVVCSACGAEISTRHFDARVDGAVDTRPLAEADVAAWEQHRCP
jgi:hypothetical protein